MYVIPGICSGSIVDERILEQSEEDVGHAHVGPHVDGLGVGNRRQRVVDAGGRRGHGQQCRYCKIVIFLNNEYKLLCEQSCSMLQYSNKFIRSCWSSFSICFLKSLIYMYITSSSSFFRRRIKLSSRRIFVQTTVAFIKCISVEKPIASRNISEPAG